MPHAPEVPVTMVMAKSAVLTGQVHGLQCDVMIVAYRM